MQQVSHSTRHRLAGVIALLTLLVAPLGFANEPSANNTLTREHFMKIRFVFDDRTVTAT
ncbi:hypothetical protein ABHF91_09035 [Pseudaeromonas sp. ZJS20]|uniref:hypothetical protein n=1 Tax=Pseudaeromonas aegiceratis TaxID=3153928 RepID=UPI00390C95B6